MTELTQQRAQFRKKPVVIEALQVSVDNLKEMCDFMGGGEHRNIFSINYVQVAVFIHTLEGTMRADKNDWIIKGIKGEFYPCKPEVFEATYEPVEAGRSSLESENARLLEAADRFAKAGVEFCQCGHINIEHYGAADWQSNLDCDYICGVKECECKKFISEAAIREGTNV